MTRQRMIQSTGDKLRKDHETKQRHKLVELVYSFNELVVNRCGQLVIET